MSKYIKRNIILFGICSLVIGCVLVPFIINWLFDIDAKGILIAKWQAEDALSYSAGVLSFIGMIVLGYISYEQAKNANKMAELAVKSASDANEISLISRIVDFEVKNLDLVRDCYERFYDTFLPQNLMKPVLECMREDGTLDIMKIQILIDYRNQLMSDFMKYGRALNIDSTTIKKEMKDFIDDIVSIYKFAVKYIEYYTSLDRNQDATQFDNSQFESYKELFTEWSIKGSKYLEKKESRLKMILFRQMTLEEIRQLYNVEERN